MDAQNNITEVSKTSQFGLSQSIRGLAVVGIAALVFVVWGISSVDYLTIYPEQSEGLTLSALGKLGTIFIPKHLITRYSPRLVSYLPCQPPKIKS